MPGLRSTLTYEGKNTKDSLDYLRVNEPDIYKDIKDFYAATSLQQRVEISKMLTKLVLKPVDGQWKDDEILAFRDNETKDLQKRGKELFQKLFLQNNRPNGAL